MKKSLLAVVLLLALCLSTVLFAGCGRSKIATADLTGSYDGSEVTIALIV